MFNIEHLNALRLAEIEKIIPYLRPQARILEIGAGTGQQALELNRRGFDITAIEIASSNYNNDRCFPITDYDGNHIPFDDASFDIVFSSNVMEHVPDLVLMNKEIRRVLKPGGYCIHIMPTHSWRFWTTLSALPTAFQYTATLKEQLLPRWPLNRSEFIRVLGVWKLACGHLTMPFRQRRHGERGSIISELWLFHPNWWRRNFRSNGFEIVHDEPMDLFYTGHMTFGARWPISKREKLAGVLGSACHLFKLKPSDRP